MIALIIAIILASASGSIVVDQYGNSTPLWNLTETPHDDKPNAPCDATEAEFHDLQCPPSK